MAEEKDAFADWLGELEKAPQPTCNNDELVATASQKIKNEKTLATLVYVKTALSELGYETDNHNPFFFTSLVNVSDKELSGFLYVNKDGFYSNCQEKSELRLICSWESVKDIVLVEEGESSMRIDIISKVGKLTIHEPYSKNMLVLLSIYKNSWQKLLKGEINIIAFETLEEYLHWLLEKTA